MMLNSQNSYANTVHTDRVKATVDFRSLFLPKKLTHVEDSEYSDVEIEDDADENLSPDQPEMQDADISNSTKPLSVARYAERIFVTDQKEESQFIIPEGRFEEVQTEITPKMREILVKWLINVHHEFNFASDTLFNTIAYLDQVLSKKNIHKNRLQLVGAVCLWMAAKVEEIRIPPVNELIELCNEPYTQAQFCRYEAKILQLLNFRLQYPTTKSFLRRYLVAVSADNPLIEVAGFMCEASLLDHRILQFRPSVVAFGIIVCSMTAIGRPCPVNLLKKYAHFENLSEVNSTINIIIESTNKVLSKKIGASYQRYTDVGSSGAVISLNIDDATIKRIYECL
ncbi:Cyclin, N-terminal domain containing protein [Trichomonas vaginalis G3]|uniref:Cyclin, N-terminal domain containing protein n=1 Tax=Trichomonas vaginalis (strain ATCC PRA-98 / G3) TaxID=412133 RepID=A2E979_TRIV3|nr:cell division [Trichomonas vaginalis G3]EAY10764.1 Cyclin, N-terminal domain containing protein [Trichomonas vaginalis G3]KAI5536098.1 cell division [Trichomonas vaginalis G3]|eukprot:XP_001322987.1 Cyclin, N-terminal domain containing protein [Trichomonas vaginalis G3]